MKPVSVAHINVLLFQHIVQIYLNTDTRQSDSTAAIAGSVIATTHRPGLFHQQHFLSHNETS